MTGVRKQSFIGDGIDTIETISAGFVRLIQTDTVGLSFNLLNQSAKDCTETSDIKGWRGAMMKRRTS